MGGIYALMAVGYSLIYSLLNFTNFAHSASVLMGAYTGYYFISLVTDNIWLAALGAVILGALLAGFIERATYQPLLDKGSKRIYLLIAGLGISIISENLIVVLIDGRFHAYETDFSSVPISIGSASIGLVDIVIMIASAIALLIVQYLITKTKVGLIYINNICKKDLINKIDNKLKNINIDGIINSNSLKRYLNTSNNFFPTIKSTERPDLTSMSLLEGKVIILTDNSPEVLILPTFFIDFFHMSDDYYQKQTNITFIRLIRLIAFLLSILLPAIYISLTTHNPDSMPIKLLLSFQKGRQNVPIPAFIEAIIMIISFEILRETDIRIPSSMGTAISILGGIVLGDAAVSAGIVSPIMIIVIAISAISGMLIQSIEVINSIRWYRFLFIILSSLFGFYGIFLGTLNEQKDAILKIQGKVKYRNPLLSNNKKRGI